MFRCVQNPGLNGKPDYAGTRPCKTVNVRSGERWLGPLSTYCRAVGMVNIFVYCVMSLLVVIVVSGFIVFMSWYCCLLYICVCIRVYMLGMVCSPGAFQTFASSFFCDVLSLYVYLCVYTYINWYVIVDSLYGSPLLYFYVV